MIRLFIALPIEPAVKDELARTIDTLRVHTNAVKWVAPDNIHLTIRFLGDTEETLVPRIKEVIDNVSEQFKAVDTAIEQIGAFPSMNRPRVFWVGLDQNAEPLSELARQMELAVRKLRYRPEKKRFSPHITLGRVRQGRDMGDLVEAANACRINRTPVKFDRILLVKSTLTPKGPIYEVLHSASLR